MLTPYNILGSVIIINFVAGPRSTNMVGVPYLFNTPTAPDTKSAPTSCGSSVRIIKPVLIPLFTIIVFTLKIFSKLIAILSVKIGTTEESTIFLIIVPL